MKKSCLILLTILLTSFLAPQASAELLGHRNKQLSMLRINELGSKFGPSNDQLDVEVVVALSGVEGNFGFQLRNDKNRPVRQGMLDLLRDAFNNGWNVNIDYDINPPRKNGFIVRVWLTKP